MLIPKRVKHRKQHRPPRRGMAKGGTAVSFGDYGLQSLEPAWITNRQIEAARIAMTRYIRRGGKVWINVYPDRPITKKLAEAKDELFKLRFQNVTGQLENGHRLGEVRKDIARILTAIRQRELAGEAVPTAVATVRPAAKRRLGRRR